MKGILLLIIIFLMSCTSQERSFPKSERECAFDETQKELAWRNVVEALVQKYPEHSKYCETDAPALSKSFNVLNGECRVYLACAKSVNGSTLLHGDWVVTINEKTQEVIAFHDVAW